MIWPEIKAKGNPDFTPLISHLEQVAMVAEKVAIGIGTDIELARYGAFLHDIGKTHPEFQRRLIEKPRIGDLPFRHEITSCLFISLFDEAIQKPLIDMVIAHHKSVRKDVREKGLLDLTEEYEPEEVFEFHSSDWENWSPKALDILSELGVKVKPLSRKEAKENFFHVHAYCRKCFKEKGYSIDRGLLMAADHFASALIDKTEIYSRQLFQKPNLNFFNRTHLLYPLPLKSADSSKPPRCV